jgi:hypothetical protein
MSVKELLSKIENYDIELTRKEVYDIIERANATNPNDIPVILDTVRKAYHLNITF